MTPEHAAVEAAIKRLISACAELQVANHMLERRALAAEDEARVLRERLEER